MIAAMKQESIVFVMDHNVTFPRTFRIRSTIFIVKPRASDESVPYPGLATRDYLNAEKNLVRSGPNFIPPVRSGPFGPVRRIYTTFVMVLLFLALMVEKR